MELTKTTRLLLLLSGLLAIGIGASILFAPAAFHATNGIVISTDASSLSEIRAPGGALLVLGAMMWAGAFARRFTRASTSIAAAVFLGYGASRLLGIGLDGVPADGLLVAAVVELVIGLLCAAALARAGMHA